jgi:hypothetical protein
MRFIGRLFLVLMLTATLSGGQAPTSVPRITDLFSADDFRKAGLSKLSAEEISALNTAIFRVLVKMKLQSGSQSSDDVSSNTETKGLDFYDSRGRAVAYIDENDESSTFYLWDGKPVAYLDDDNVYGFNGKHLGWIKGSGIYDHDGNVVAALSEAFKSSVSAAPPKSFKQFTPFKAFKEFEPFKPFFTLSWSETPARVFFLRGVS